MKTNNKGFSLVELIVVIAIMAILAAVAIPTFSGFIKKANVASDTSFLNDAAYAAEIAYSADTTKTVKSVTVELNEDGNANKITIAFVESGVTAVEITKNDTDSAIETEIAACIDWGYIFKTTDTLSVTVNQ